METGFQIESNKDEEGTWALRTPTATEWLRKGFLLLVTVQGKNQHS